LIIKAKNKNLIIKDKKYYVLTEKVNKKMKQQGSDRLLQDRDLSADKKKIERLRKKIAVKSKKLSEKLRKIKNKWEKRILSNNGRT